jgi:hypothetical protein
MAGVAGTAGVAGVATANAKPLSPRKKQHARTRTISFFIFLSFLTLDNIKGTFPIVLAKTSFLQI